MKKIFKTKYLTMVCFLVFVTTMCLLTIPSFYMGAKRMALIWLNVGKLDVSVIETMYSEEFTGKCWFINGNGVIQRLTGARVVNERVKLDNGHLTYTIPKENIGGFAENTIAFKNVLEKQGIPFLYVNAPFKIHEVDKQLPVGVEDYSNENTDEFLSYIDELGVDVLDLRDCIADEGLDHYSLFYKTDHHWKAETGFWAAGKISDRLAQINSSFAANPDLWNPSNYSFDVYEDPFLGSSGVRVGEVYAGVDYMTLITPNFKTELTFSVESEDIYREGNFSDVFLFREHLTAENLLKSTGYAVYCNGIHDILKIKNYGTGIDGTCQPRKVLLINDSFGNVVTPFLSLAFEQTHVLDLRLFEGNLMDYVDEYDPDAVLIIYNPGAYNDDNREMFDFLN